MSDGAARHDLAAPPTVVLPRPAAEGEEIDLEPDDAAHLRVLRARPRTPLRGIDGHGGEYDLELLRSDHGGAVVRIRAARRGGRELAADLWLVQAALHTARMDVVVEKAAELGARGIVVVPAARSQRVALEGRVDRWARIARAATCQSLGAVLPEIRLARHIDAALQDLGAEHVVFADPSGGPLEPSLVAGGRRVAVVVGPEGGLTDEERGDLVRTGAVPVGLGPRRLRAETAAVVLLGGVARLLAG